MHLIMMVFELVSIIVTAVSFGNNALDLIPMLISVTCNVIRNFIRMSVDI